MWANVGTLIAEAEDIQHAAGLGYGREARHIFRPLIGVEGVEQPAVEHRLELAAEAFEMERVGRFEPGFDSSIRGLLPGGSESRLGHVDAEGRQSKRSGQKRMFAGTATRIEHRSGECALGCQC